MLNENFKVGLLSHPAWSVRPMLSIQLVNVDSKNTHASISFNTHQVNFNTDRYQMMFSGSVHIDGLVS
jgi:hypothetical protein